MYIYRTNEKESVQLYEVANVFDNLKGLLNKQTQILTLLP